MRTEDGLKDQVAAIADAIEWAAGRPLTPEDVQEVKNALFADPPVFSDVLHSERAYLVIGSYASKEERRLLTVKRILARRRPDDHAFLLKDVPAFARNLAIKFHVLAHRVDYVVGVFEHNRGGHE